jgi:hypothetical protein
MVLELLLMQPKNGSLVSGLVVELYCYVLLLGTRASAMRLLDLQRFSSKVFYYARCVADIYLLLLQNTFLR